MADIIKNPKNYEKYEMDKVFTIKKDLNADKLRDFDDWIRALTLKFSNKDKINLISSNITDVRALRKQIYDDFDKLSEIYSQNKENETKYSKTMDDLINKLFDYEC